MIRVNSSKVAWQLIQRHYSLWRCRSKASSETCILVQGGRHLSLGEKSTTNKKQFKGQFIEEQSRVPTGQRLKNMIVLYGPLGTALHICLSLTFLGITYLIVAYGVDVPMLLQRYDFIREDYMRIVANGGNFGLAYALYKAMMPFRALVTIALTPKVARKLQAAGIIKKRF